MRLTNQNPEQGPASAVKVPLLNASLRAVSGNRPVGRPRCPVTCEEITKLRCAKLSWRQIARTLRIGTATAIRLYRAKSGASEASQNSQRDVLR